MASSFPVRFLDVSDLTLISSANNGGGAVRNGAKCCIVYEGDDGMTEEWESILISALTFQTIEGTSPLTLVAYHSLLVYECAKRRYLQPGVD